MATENVNILSIKQNGQWVEIPALKGDPGVAFTEVTILASDWNGTTNCTKQVSGITAQSHVVLSPAPVFMPAVINKGIYCNGQGNGTLSFTCASTPVSDITFEVMYDN